MSLDNERFMYLLEMAASADVSYFDIYAVTPRDYEVMSYEQSNILQSVRVMSHVGGRVLSDGISRVIEQFPNNFYKSRFIGRGGKQIKGELSESAENKREMSMHYRGGIKFLYSSSFPTFNPQLQLPHQLDQVVSAFII